MVTPIHDEYRFSEGGGGSSTSKKENSSPIKEKMLSSKETRFRNYLDNVIITY